MSLIVSIYTKVGFIMASDSRLTCHNQQVKDGKTIIKYGIYSSDTLYKTFLCPNNVGISYCGEDIADNHLLSDIIQTFIQNNISVTTPIIKIPDLILAYLTEMNLDPDLVMHIAGYYNNEQYIYRLITKTKSIFRMNEKQLPGAAWEGETEFLVRAIKSCFIIPEAEIKKIQEMKMANEKETLNVKNVLLVEEKNVKHLPESNIPWHLFSIKDGIDFAKFAIKYTEEASRFTMSPKTVGGPIDILVITPLEAYWVERKNI